MHHKSKLPNVGTSIFTLMSTLANKHNAINLSQGYPNFKSDKALMKLVYKAMRNGYNQYAHMRGVMALRKAISGKFELLYGNSYQPDTEITVTAGATQAIFTAITAIVNAGDEVIVFRPAYDCYVPTIRLNGGIPISLPLDKPNYRIDWDRVRQSISSKQN